MLNSDSNKLIRDLQRDYASGGANSILDVLDDDTEANLSLI